MGRINDPLPFQIFEPDSQGFQPVIQDVLQAVFMSGQFQPAGQIDHDLLVLAAFFELQNPLLGDNRVFRDIRQLHDLIHLGPECRRQHIVGQCRSRCHKEIRHHQCIQAHQRLVHHTGIGHRNQGMASEYHHCPDRIGVPGQDRPEDPGDMRGRNRRTETTQ